MQKPANLSLKKKAPFISEGKRISTEADWQPQISTIPTKMLQDMIT